MQRFEIDNTPRYIVFVIMSALNDTELNTNALDSFAVICN